MSFKHLYNSIYLRLSNILQSRLSIFTTEGQQLQILNIIMVKQNRETKSQKHTKAEKKTTKRTHSQGKPY